MHAHCMYPLTIRQCLVNFTSGSKQASSKCPVTVTCAATRKVAGIPWVTARRQAWASTLPVPWAQATSEKTPGGLPWETRSSPPTSPAEAEKATNTRNFSETPARTAATPDSPPGTSPTSGKRGCSLLHH